jgi:hypothetical protein
VSEKKKGPVVKAPFFAFPYRGGIPTYSIWFLLDFSWKSHEKRACALRDGWMKMLQKKIRE